METWNGRNVLGEQILTLLIVSAKLLIQDILLTVFLYPMMVM